MKTNLISLITAAGLFVETAHAADCCSGANAASCPQLSGKSVYQLDATWTNDQAQAVPLVSLKGRVRVVTMFFTHCQYACPLLVYKMQQIQAALPENVRTNVGFTLFSFDSERDTPAMLRDYRAARALGGDWTLLQGNAEDVLNLVAVLGVKYKKDAQGQFMHSNVITILNAGGEIACQETGLNMETDEIVRRIGQLVKH